MLIKMNLSKFQGSLVGVVVGDCLGSPFEGNRFIAKSHLNKYFNQLRDPKVKLPFKPYTDDTAMTKSVALSLIENKGIFDPKDMAKRFVTEYFKDPRRGYGSSIGDVFQGLRLSGIEDPYGPAQRQFGGSGSYGNGGAMRVTPIGLLNYQDTSQLVQMATLGTQITHTHPLGVKGAILQALAVQKALQAQSDKPVDVKDFTDSLIQEMAKVESLWEDKKDEFSGDRGKGDKNIYVKKLEIVKSFLNRKEPPLLEEIDESLGVHVSAHLSVPTALYCYLMAQKDIPEIETDNMFQRTIQYAYSLGGDTDTIGSMAGGIAGAHCGFEAIPSTLLSRCEGTNEALAWAEGLYNLSVDKKREATKAQA